MLAEVLGSVAGGIAGLLTLPAEQWQAIEADLLRCGKTRSQLGTPDLPWSAVVAMVRHTSRGDALHREVHGDLARFAEVEYMLADVIDALNTLVWFKTKDGQKGRNRPKPYPRPQAAGALGISDAEISDSGALQVGKGQYQFGTPLTLDELDRFLMN